MSLRKQIKRRLPLVGIFLLLLIGVGIFMYPIVSNWYGEYTAHTEISNYDRVIQDIGNEAILKIQKQADDYNSALADNDAKKLEAIDYNTLLAVSESIAYIEIPKINVYLPEELQLIRFLQDIPGFPRRIFLPISISSKREIIFISMLLIRCWHIRSTR